MNGEEPDFTAAALHASNSGECSLASLLLLHGAMDWSHGQVNMPVGAGTRDPGKLVWEHLAYLRLPRVIWGIGDVFDFAPPSGFTRHLLLLPTNSDLDTSAALVNDARARYGNGPFNELMANRPARVLPEDRVKAERLESGLIGNGVIVGREAECYFHDPNYASFFVDDTGSLPNRRTIRAQLAVTVSSHGPLTPDVYADWVFSGISLPEQAWERHLRVLRAEGR